MTDDGVGDVMVVCWSVGGFRPACSVPGGEHGEAG